MACPTCGAMENQAPFESPGPLDMWCGVCQTGYCALCMIAPTDKDIEDWLRDLILDEGDKYPKVQTFAEAHIMTTNAGLVLEFPNGVKYQITVVKG